jgi:maltose alpha-D-glucosyltransferase/alpha-amylase
MVTEEERQWMWKEYAPEMGMRLNLGIRRRLAPLIDNDYKMILLAYSVLFSLPGSPVLYYGDEIGMGDDIRRPDRDGLRSPMQWDSTYQAGFTTSNAPYAEVISNDEFGPKRVNAASELKDPQSLLSTIKKMIQVRKAHPVFAIGDLTDLEGLPVSVAGFSRSGEGERLIILNNLSSEAQPVRIPCPDGCSSRATDLLTNQEFQIEGEGLSLRLQPHEYCWLKL